MAIDISSIEPSIRLHEVLDPSTMLVIYTGGPRACARYINSLPAARQDRMVLRPVGRR